MNFNKLKFLFLNLPKHRRNFNRRALEKQKLEREDREQFVDLVNQLRKTDLNVNNGYNRLCFQPLSENLCKSEDMGICVIESIIIDSNNSILVWVRKVNTTDKRWKELDKTNISYSYLLNMIINYLEYAY